MAQRSIASSVISFGLVTIPVKIYLACSAVGPKFNMITPSGHRVRQKFEDAQTGEEVQADVCLKGIEFAKDQFVTFTPDELRAFDAEKSPNMKIMEFVKLDSVDMLQVEKTYYLGPGKGAEKPYGLLGTALHATKKAGVAKWTNRGREHLVLLRPYKGGLVMHQMFYGTEIRDFSEIKGELGEITSAELDLANKLVRAMSGKGFDPNNYTDGYATSLQAAVDARIAGQTVVFAGGPEAQRATVVDLMAALAGSLEPESKT